MSRKLPPAVSRAQTSETSKTIIPRRFPRVPVDLAAQYAIEGQPDWHTSVIDDLGGGGVRLETQEDVAAGTIVSLRFDVEGTSIRATARVAMSLFDRSRARYVHGVAFTSIDPAQQRAIVRRVVALQSGEKA
jgi:c-di-GMP-binding flagellar brake protein YcgR